MLGDDIANGVVIGEVTSDKFITFHDKDTGEQLVSGGWYKDDAAAIESLRERHPSLCKIGVEMRVHGEGVV